MTWSARTSWDTVCRRAAGRRRYHSIRRLRATLRQRQIIKLISRKGGMRRGIQAWLARKLGVSEATISRDIWKRIFGGSQRTKHPWPKEQKASVANDLRRVG